MKGKYHIHRVVALMAWPFNAIIYLVKTSVLMASRCVIPNTLILFLLQREANISLSNGLMVIN